MAVDLKAKIAAIPQAQPYGLSTVVPPPELPERAGALSPMMQSIARNYLGARGRAGEAILDAARYLAEARQAAKYGEWGIFLEATGTQEDTASRMIAIADRANADQQYARAIIDGRLAFTAAFEILNAPAETQQKALESDARTPVSTIRAEKQAAKLRNVAEFESNETPAPFWQSLSANHPTAHLWTQIGPDAYRTACGMAHHAPGGSTEDGHCSSCVRATWPQNQAAEKPNISEPPATPDLADILLRLDAHGYAKTGTRQKGITTYHSFRDFRSDAKESTGELELAEGELPYWLAELDDNARRALARQEQFLDMQQRFAVFDWRLRRENKEFGLYNPNGGCVGVWKNLDQHMRQLKELERSRANRIARGDPAYAAEIAAAAQPDPTIPHLPPDFTDAQKRAAKINLLIAMDMNGKFSIKNAGGSGVDQIAEWESLKRHLTYAEQDAAEIAAKRNGQAPAAAESNADQQYARRVIELLNQIAPLMKLVRTEDIEGLAGAISDLNECEEGTEAEHWLKVGYALCDVDPN